MYTNTYANTHKTQIGRHINIQYKCSYIHIDNHIHIDVDIDMDTKMDTGICMDIDPDLDLDPLYTSRS